MEREGMVRQDALGSAVQTLQNARVQRTERIGNSLPATLGGDLKAQVTLLLDVRVLRHHGGGQRGAVLLVHLVDWKWLSCKQNLLWK